MVTDHDVAGQQIRKAFGPGSAQIRCARAPYRLSPLGAHTDHQEGLTCGFTLDHALHLWFRPAGGSMVRLRSREYPDPVSFDLHEVPGPSGGWGDYVKGVACELAGAADLERGVEGIVAGDLGPGGISSSAALQVAVLLALCAANNLSLDRRRAVDLVVAAERSYSGVNVGILDPAVILSGREHSLVYIDCRERKPRLHRISRRMAPFEWLLVDSGIPRELRSSPYNERVEACRRAARQAGAEGDRPVLRDVDPETFRRRRGEVDPEAARYAEHVFAENKRVRLALQAVANGDLAGLGRLIAASGESLTRLFDCGTPETRALLELLSGTEGILGASYAGAGWGGMLHALAHPGTAERVAGVALKRFAGRFPEAAARAAVTPVGMGPGADVS